MRKNAFHYNFTMNLIVFKLPMKTELGILWPNYWCASPSYTLFQEVCICKLVLDLEWVPSVKQPWSLWPSTSAALCTVKLFVFFGSHLICNSWAMFAVGMASSTEEKSTGTRGGWKEDKREASFRWWNETDKKSQMELSHTLC